MKRKAILIISPGNVGTQEYLPGVQADRNNWYSFLTSSTGGAWDDNEILIYHNPTRAEIMDIPKIIKNYDYSLTAFSGHGGYDPQTNKTHIWINEDTSDDIALLNFKVKKQLLIIDSCRSYTNFSILAEDSKRSRTTSNEHSIKRQLDKLWYNERINKCAEGITKVFSADLNQAAGENPTTGGYFTQALIKSAQQQDLYTNFILDTQTAFEYACKQIEEPQKPVIENGRRFKSDSFPFAVNHKVRVED